MAHGNAELAGFRLLVIGLRELQIIKWASGRAKDLDDLRRLRAVKRK
ncbi:MAG: hypothetical protein NTX19_08275 [Gemmatimonadetes bacterium]|nr:hypothetical protein [Gemmatimonadota bacterium]